MVDRSVNGVVGIGTVCLMRLIDVAAARACYFELFVLRVAFLQYLHVRTCHVKIALS